MFARLINHALGRNREFPYGKCFVSHAYADKSGIDELRKYVRRRARLFVFPPIDASPHQMASNRFLRAIRRCDSLIYLTGGASSVSPWVTLERDYALRSGLDVYYFDPKTGTIGRDTSEPLDLPVFASYSSLDGKRVKDLMHFMRRKRSSDIFIDLPTFGPDVNIGEKIREAMVSRLERGGYVVLFLSDAASKSHFVDAEVRLAIELVGRGRVVVALLNHVELPSILRPFEGALLDSLIVPLYGNDGTTIDKRQLDKLIVYIYKMVDKNSDSRAAT